MNMTLDEQGTAPDLKIIYAVPHPRPTPVCVRCELDGQSPRFSRLMNVEAVASSMDGAAAESGKPRVAAGSHTTAMFTPRSHARSEARNIS
jgi:hypothetical protein